MSQQDTPQLPLNRNDNKVIQYNGRSQREAERDQEAQDIMIGNLPKVKEFHSDIMNDHIVDQIDRKGMPGHEGQAFFHFLIADHKLILQKYIPGHDKKDVDR